MNTEVRSLSLPINQWIVMAAKMTMLIDKTRRDAVGQMVAGGAGLAMLQAARSAERVRKELLAAIDARFDELGRSELLSQQQMAREELLELGNPSDNETVDYAQLRDDTQRLLDDASSKIQEMGRRTLVFEIPSWVADTLAPVSG